MRAGEVVRASFGLSLRVEMKAARQPVTEADRAADRLLRDLLLGARPQYGWVSEESDPSGGEDAARRWIVDPLDGTTNFVAGRPEFAVAVGLLERGTAVVGVVYNPLSGELYHAVAGEGAFLDERPIRARRRGSGKPLLMVSHDEWERGELRGLEGAFEVGFLGSTALKMAAVAAGRADAYVSRGRKAVWDLAAPAVIAREAGAAVHALSGARLPDAGEAEGVIVCSTEDHELPGAIRRSLRE